VTTRVSTAAAAAADADADAKQSSVGLGMDTAADVVADHRLLPCHSRPYDLQERAANTRDSDDKDVHARLQPLVSGLASSRASQHLPRWRGPAQRLNVRKLFICRYTNTYIHQTRPNV